MKDANDAALSVWAVTCDALARGEQTFHLLPDAGGDLSRLPHREFWLRPDWEGPDPRSLTEPYQDRKRALDDVRHDDGRVRLKYYATVEYLEPLEGPGALRALDGDHVLRSGGVRELFRRARRRVSLLVLRVHERPEPEVLDAAEITGSPTGGPWLRLPEPLSTRGLEPVMSEDRFVAEKARLLQRTGAIRAV